MAGDDASAPILAYSFQDSAPTAGNLPCNLRSWMEAMSGQISTMRKEGATASAAVVQQSTISERQSKQACFSERWGDRCKPWESASAGETEVLLEAAKWNQYDPYNLQCPMDGSERSITGCTSTATAIVMRYFQWPERGIGESEEYTTETNKILVEARNLNHAYDWDNMPLVDISTNYTTSQAEAVSTLIDHKREQSGKLAFQLCRAMGRSLQAMADVGACFKVDYTASSTYGSISIEALNNHFGYSANMFWEYADAYGPDDWTARLKDEISSTGPVLYRGAGDAGSHVFILDGYTYDGYFHINWGWGGYSDGYFLLPAMAFSEGRLRSANRASSFALACTTFEYAYEQEAYFNVKPDDGTEAESTLRMHYPGMSLDVEEVSRNVYFNIAEAYASNISVADWDGYVCFALTDSNGDIKEWISDEIHYTNLLPFNYYYSYYNVPCLITEDFSEGDRIRMFYKNSEEGEWKLLYPRTADAVWEIVIGEDVAKGEDGPEGEAECVLRMYAPGISLDVSTLTRNVAFNVAEAYALNVTPADWEGYVCFALTDSNGDITEWISDEIHYASPLPYNYYYSYYDVPCLITVGFSDGDRIRMFYKDSEAGQWKLMMSYTDGVVWEIVIGEDVANSVEAIPMAKVNDGEALYDLAGRRVAKPKKGSVYISGGRKILY
ncbi:MAG: C10 family peptidase [Prevotellaceae bacterium]|nr:C10 family peptidase [Prevotellaceae bacterium]